MPVRHFSTWRLVVRSTQGTIHVETTLRLKSRFKSRGCFQCLCRFASNDAQQEIADQSIRRFDEICDRGLAERLVGNRDTEKHMFVVHHLFLRAASMASIPWPQVIGPPSFAILFFACLQGNRMMKTYNRSFAAVSPLTREQCRIMQQDGKERPGRNEYWYNKEPGRYVDVAAGEPLFAFADKFDSSTGCRSRSQSRLHSP